MSKHYKKDIIHIWTDGSIPKQVGNDVVGGWAAVIVYKNRARIVGGYDVNKTSNQMEAIAVAEALSVLLPPFLVRLNTDSSYVKTNIEKIKAGIIPNTNTVLWSNISELILPNIVTVYKVTAHNNNIFNLLADLYARYCAVNTCTVSETHNGLSMVLNKIIESK